MSNFEDFMIAKTVKENKETETLRRQRNALLDAAKAANNWIKTITSYDDSVPYIYGRYDSMVDSVLLKLRVAIESTEKKTVDFSAEEK